MKIAARRVVLHPVGKRPPRHARPSVATSRRKVVTSNPSPSTTSVTVPCATAPWARRAGLLLRPEAMTCWGRAPMWRCPHPSRPRPVRHCARSRPPHRPHAPAPVSKPSTFLRAVVFQPVAAYAHRAIPFCQAPAEYARWPPHNIIWPPWHGIEMPPLPAPDAPFDHITGRVDDMRQGRAEHLCPPRPVRGAG